MIKTNRVQKYFLNALILSCASILVRSVSVSFNVYVTSRVGAEGMGLLTLVSSVYGFAITLATSGINLAVVRLVSASYIENASGCADKKSYTSSAKIMKNALLYCLIFSLTASIVLYISAYNIGSRLLGDIRTVSSLKILAYTLIPISLSSALNGYFCAVRRVYKNVIIQTAEQFVKIGVVSALLVLIAPRGLEYACIAVISGGAVAEAGSVLLSFIFYITDRRLHKEKISPDEKKGSVISSIPAPKGFNDIFSLAFPIAVSAYVRSALSTIEHLAIPWGLKRSGESAGAALASYGILHGMVIPILLFPSAVLNAFSSLLVPELSSAQAMKQNNRITYIVSRVMTLTLIFATGVAGIFTSFSYEIGMLLYGSAEAAEFIKILSPLIPLMYLDGAVDTMLKGLGEQIYSMRVNIADSLLSVILILTLLPAMGITGYVVVIFITELFNTSFSIIRLLNITGVKTPVVKWVVKPLITVILSTLITRFLFDYNILLKLFSFMPQGKLLLISQIAIASFLYIIISRIIGVISKDDVKWAKGIVNIKSSA